MRLIYLSPVPWNSFSQRPHELVRYFHLRTGGQVLWVDPYPTRLPVLSDVLSKSVDAATQHTHNPDWLTVVKPKVLPIEPLPFSGYFNQIFWRSMLKEFDRFFDSTTLLGIGKPSELALDLLQSKKFSFSFYDAMDNFPAFYAGLSRISMERRERKIVRKVRTVLASSSMLQGRLSSLSGDVRLVLNACASSRMPAARKPQTLALATGRVPVIGYVGTIARWFDWELVDYLARAYPQAKFRIIGPIYERPPKTLPLNITLEPALTHSAALQAMAQFDIGLIPFKRTPLTTSVDPIKYYEYRALGLGIISSVFGEMARRSEQDGVWLIDRKSHAKEILGRALKTKMSAADISKFRETNSWESRFDQSCIFANT